MNYSNKFLTLSVLFAALAISTASVQAMEKRESERISVAQFNALPFDEMEKRIEQRLREITMRFNSKNFNYGSAYANVIRALIDGVKNGASSTKQLAIIKNSASGGDNAITGLFRACHWSEYLIAQFILYRAGITDDDLVELLELVDNGRTVLWTAAYAGPVFVDLLLNHPIFKSQENEDFLVKFITTPDHSGMTILHYVAYMTENLDVVKKLIGKLLRRVDFNTLHAFIHAPIEAKDWWGLQWNNMTAAQIAREWSYPKLQLAEFLENFDETRFTCEVKARKAPKRCAELYKKREEEENKLRYTKERITQFLEKMKVARAKIHAVGNRNDE